MTGELSSDPHLEIAHVLFIDIVGYSKRLVNEQSALVQQLNQLIRKTEQFRSAEEAGKLIRIPTGDGMALVFFTSPDAPVRCATEVSHSLGHDSPLQLRMGIHSGPVEAIADVNDRSNVAGAGINVAQRVMDCGDAGHILLSQRIADDLAQYTRWQPFLHALGEAEVKHGVRLCVVNFYGDGFGSAKLPEKLQHAQEEKNKVTRRRRRRRKLYFGGAAALTFILLGIGFLVWQRAPRSTTANAIVEKSIAVLPFDNFGDEKEYAYFADGVQDDILTDLAKVSDLKVISRKSVAQFRGSTKGAREIGQALGVGHLLEGSVRKAAGRIRITVQLIDTRTDQHLWAETYDRDLADVFAIQSELAQKIASALKAALSPEEKAAIEKPPTDDMEAYDLYLRARALVYDFGAFVKMDEENSEKAIPLLEKAIARDPKFSLAYCLLAEAQLTLYGTELRNPARLAKAREASDAALSIAPESGQAHLIRAFLCWGALQNEKCAADELATAAKALPGEAGIYDLSADMAEKHGRWKEALVARRKAVELNPRTPDSSTALIDLEIDLRRYDEAERKIDRTIGFVAPQDSSGLWRRKSHIALAKGNTKAAMAALDASPNRNIGLTGLNHEVALLHMMDRDYTKAIQIVESLGEVARAHHILPKVGLNHFAQGRYRLTLATIQRAQHENEKARTSFESARQEFVAWLENSPDEASALGFIAIADAGLGRKDDAIREGKNAVSVWPMSRDAREAAIVATDLAQVYAWTNERDAAIAQLSEVVKLVAGPTYGELKLSPAWDDLRGDPRFGKIIMAASEPVKID